MANAEGRHRTPYRLGRVPGAKLREADHSQGRDVAPRCHRGRWKTWWKLVMISATGFLVDFGRLRPAFRGRQETARFPSGPAQCPVTPPRAESHAFCVGAFDLASVSPNVRSVSNSVRRRPPIVSANLRRKVSLIARRPHFDCAPLHIRGTWAWGDALAFGDRPKQRRRRGRSRWQ